MTKQDEKNPNHEENQSSSQQSHTGPDGRPIENSILRMLPYLEYATLQPHLELIDLPMQQVLQEVGERIEFGYFLNSGLVSLMVVTSDARSVEVGMVGREGFVGAPLVLGHRNSSQRALVQIKGSALRVKADVLRNIVPELPALREQISRFVLSQALQAAQLVACNRLHEVEQRLARWLLMTHDRSAGDSLPITHDLLAQMLGSGRPSVTLAAGVLQRAGTIEYTRGQVTVLDRKALEHSACECYGAIRRIASSASES
ncbi:MAG TPA: Crp/Fnr family transcriptional regulator [Terriglobales bacterium]|nr:Crp/Fnr family transcriptional regulator [Terriglobales bacterium]